MGYRLGTLGKEGGIVMNISSKVLVFLLFLAIPSSNIVAQKKKYVIGCWQAGFFSSFFHVITHLVGCEKHQRTPVVYWDKSSFFYTRDGYNGSYNVWEYYFEPVSRLGYHPGDKIHADYFGPSKFYIPWAPIQECFKPTLRLFVHGIIKKYIKIKPVIQHKIDTFKQNNMSNTVTIGIHLRGTDKKREVRQIDPLLILNHANELADKIGDNCQFFVATDEARLLELAQNTLHRNVIFYDSIRSTNGKPVHINADNPAIMGEQVLIEAKLLSECNYFLHTLSNVSMAVCCFNPRLKNIAFDQDGKVVIIK